MLAKQIDIWKERFELVKSNLSFVLVRHVKNDVVEITHNSTPIDTFTKGDILDVSSIFMQSEIPHQLDYETKTPLVLKLKKSFNPFEMMSCSYQNIQGDLIGLWVPERKLEGYQNNDLLASAAHDLRSPIHSILGLANVIELMTKSEKLDRDELTKIAQMIKISCSDAIDFTNDVLEMSNIESSNYKLDKETVYMGAFIRHYINTHRLVTLKKSIQVRFTNSLKSDGRIKINKVKVTRVFDNLMSNAVKFSPKGSRIDIVLEKTDGGLNVKFKDHGIGMPEEMLQSIFTKFGESRRKGLLGEKSHGLGMPIVKHIMDLHEGSIAINSQERQGTEVNLTFKI